MKAANLTDKELRKEIRRLDRNLSRRIANIEGLGSSAPQYAINRYREATKDVKSLSALSNKQLVTLHRDLRYIDALKSSTVKGAKDVAIKFEPIREALEALSPNMRDKFWEIYGKLYERTGNTMEGFKYEIFATNVDYIYGGQEVDKAVFDIINAYDETREQLGGSARDEEIKLLFTQKLQTLRK